jgi:hypothetical protein
VTVDLDASRDDLSGKPILSLFLCSSLFHLWPELTGPATPTPAVRRVKHLEMGTPKQVRMPSRALAPALAAAVATARPWAKPACANAIVMGTLKGFPNPPALWLQAGEARLRQRDRQPGLV